MDVQEKQAGNPIQEELWIIRLTPTIPCIEELPQQIILLIPQIIALIHQATANPELIADQHTIKLLRETLPLVAAHLLQPEDIHHHHLLQIIIPPEVHHLLPITEAVVVHTAEVLLHVLHIPVHHHQVVPVAAVQDHPAAVLLPAVVVAAAEDANNTLKLIDFKI